MAPGTGRGTSRGSSRGASSHHPTVDLPPTSAVSVQPPSTHLSIPVCFVTRVVRGPQQIRVPWRRLQGRGDEAALAPRDIIEEAYALDAVKALHAEGDVVVQVRWRPFVPLRGHPNLGGREWRPETVKRILALPVPSSSSSSNNDDEGEDDDADIELLTDQLTPPKPATATATTDISSGGDNDDDGEEIVITTRQLAEINGVLVFEGEDEDRDALSCPLIRRYHEGTLRVLVREAPFLARPRARAGEFDVAVRMVEGSGEEDESEEEPTALLLRVRKHFTVEGVTKLLHKFYGLPRRGLALSFQGEPLLHDRRLSSYGIGAGATLCLRVEPIEGQQGQQGQAAGAGGEEASDTASVASSSTTATTATTATSSNGPDPNARFTITILSIGGLTSPTTPSPLALRCSPLDTVGFVLERWGKEAGGAGAGVGLLPRDAALLFAGTRLDPFGVLYDYGVGEGATLELLLSQPLRLSITPINPSLSSSNPPQRLLVCVLGTATVGDLKERVAAVSGVAAGGQRLMFEGEEVGETEAAWLEEEQEEEEEGGDDEERKRRSKTLWELGLRDRAALTLLLPRTGDSPYHAASGERDACLATEGEGVVRVVLSTLLDDGALLSQELEVGQSVSFPVLHAYATRLRTSLVSSLRASSEEEAEAVRGELRSLGAQRQELTRRLTEVDSRVEAAKGLLRYLKGRVRGAGGRADGGKQRRAAEAAAAVRTYRAALTRAASASAAAAAAVAAAGSKGEGDEEEGPQ